MQRNMNASAHLMLGSALTLRVELADLPVEDRRSIFNALLRDAAVVTAAPGTVEHTALVDAAQAACKWGKS